MHLQKTHRPHHLERWNTLTHGAGWLLSIVAVPVIVAVAVERAHLSLVIGCIVYSLTLIGVFAFSTLSHAVQESDAKRRLSIWDQGVIYLYIAGTYTPFLCARDAAGGWQWGCLAAVWFVAVVGFCSKVVSEHRIATLSTRTYILLGWGPAMALVYTVSPTCMFWILCGGLSYSLGVIFLKYDYRYPYLHVAWHLFVILGSVFHYYAIYLHATRGLSGHGWDIASRIP